MSQPLEATATIANVKTYGQELVNLEQELENIKSRTQEINDRRNWIRQVELPRMMQELEIDSIGVGRLRIVLDTLIEAALPKDPQKRLNALNWLHDNGHAGTLKTVLNLDLPRDNDALVEQAKDMLESLSLHPTIDHVIHPQTYKALCRELVRSGAVAPFADLGVFVGKIAKVAS